MEAGPSGLQLPDLMASTTIFEALAGPRRCNSSAQALAHKTRLWRPTQGLRVAHLADRVGAWPQGQAPASGVDGDSLTEDASTGGGAGDPPSAAAAHPAGATTARAAAGSAAAPSHPRLSPLRIGLSPPTHPSHGSLAPRTRSFPPPTRRHALSFPPPTRRHALSFPPPTRHHAQSFPPPTRRHA